MLFKNLYSPLVGILEKSLETDSFLILQVREEIKQCYELINRLGRGVVYLGSSRMGPGHSHYVQAQELAKEASKFLLLECPNVYYYN